MFPPISTARWDEAPTAPTSDAAPALRPLSVPAQFVLAFAGWTLLGAFGLLRRFFQTWASGGGLQPGEIADQIETMWLWALYTPLIFQLAEWFPLERARAAQRLGAHTCFALALSSLDVCLDALILPLISPERRPFRDRLFGEAFINVFSYFALLSLGLALRFYWLYHERRLASAKLETELVSAKLSALENRLRPHFLYNALHTVGGLVRTQQSAAALRMLAGLGELLRHTLRDASDHEVALARELDLVRLYLNVEQARFGDKLRLRFEIDAQVEGAHVPSLLLQPLVENAVRHGVENNVSGGEIFIRARRQDDSLYLEVEDTGAGSSETTREPSALPRPKIGLATTRAHLQHLYGNDQRLELRKTAGGGTLALVQIPFCTTPRLP